MNRPPDTNTHTGTTYKQLCRNEYSQSHYKINIYKSDVHKHTIKVTFMDLDVHKHNIRKKMFAKFVIASFRELSVL